MNRTIKQGYRLISAVLIFVLCVNTLFSSSIPSYAAETAPGIETNAVHTYNNTRVTEGVIYETAPESGKVWGSTPLIESTQPKTMAAPMSTSSGVVKPSDKENDSSSHDGMYADTGSNHIDGVGGHYETKKEWIIDGYKPIEIVVPAVYKIEKVYVPSQRVLVDKVVAGHYETVFVPTKEVRTQKWVERKETQVARWVPSSTAYRNVTKPGYWTTVSHTIPGHYETRRVYEKPRTERIRIRTGSTYRYVTRTVGGKYVSKRVWVPSKLVSQRKYIPPKTDRVPYTVPGHTVYDKKVVEGHYEEIVSSIPGHNEQVWVEAKTVKEWKTIPEKEIEKKVLVSAEWTRTTVEPYGHYETKKVWVADPGSSGGNSDASGDTGDSGSDSSDETDTDHTEEDTTSNSHQVHGMKGYFDSVVFPEVPQLEGFSRQYVGSSLQWVYTGPRELGSLSIKEREEFDNAIAITIKELEKMEEMRVLGMKMLGEIRSYMNKAENGFYYQNYLNALKANFSGSKVMIYGRNPEQAWEHDKKISSEDLYIRYVEDTSLVKATGILGGLKNLNVSQMSLEEYINYMGPIWELNKKYRGIEDVLEDLQLCLQLLGCFFAGMGGVKLLSKIGIIEATLDLLEAGISFVLGDYVGFTVGAVSIVLPEFLDSGLKTAKKVFQNNDNLLELLSKKECKVLIDQLEEAGYKDVTKVEMRSNGVKIHSASGVIDAKWTDEIVEGASNLIDIDAVRPLLKTEPDGAFFWSGRYINESGEAVGVMDDAARIAKDRGGNTLETMIETKGIQMPEWDIDNPASIKAWEDVSAAYANQVSGEVKAVIGSQLREGNIWENVELPRLKANPNVTKIITIDPVTMIETIIFER